VPGCGRSFARSAGYLDLRPKAAFGEQTRYLDEALHADARHERVSPPLLPRACATGCCGRSAAWPGDRVIDLGCGSGRTLVWNDDSGAYQVGVDVSPFFANDALSGADLALGDLRALPFADGAFTKGYALDVFEHLSREGSPACCAKRPACWLRAGSCSRTVTCGRTRAWRSACGSSTGLPGCSIARAPSTDPGASAKVGSPQPARDIPDLERAVGEAGFESRASATTRR